MDGGQKRNLRPPSERDIENLLVSGFSLHDMSRSDSSAALDRIAIARFDCLDGILKCRLQDALADSADHHSERPPLEVLALAHHDGIHIGRSVGPPCESV